MKRIIVSITFLLSTLSIGSTIENKKKAVIVLSLDGVGYEQLKKIDPSFLESHKLSPLKPGNPSLTFPGHATLSTGVSAVQHGVFGNDPTSREIPHIKSNEEIPLYIGQTSRLKVPPIWLFAKQQNIEVLIHQWPMSNGRWCGQQIRDDSDQIFSYEDVSIEKTTSSILSKLNSWDKQKNLLVYSYSVAIDVLGHTKGPYDAETINEWSNIKIKMIDFISSIQKFSKDSSTDISLYVVSDHGMYENWYTESIDIKHYLKINGFPNDIPLVVKQSVFGFPKYELSDDQLKVLKKDFLTIQSPLGLYAFRPQKTEQVFSISPQSELCKKQNLEIPYLWEDCNIFAGGHHVYNPKVHQKHLDGIFWNPVGKNKNIPRQQTDFVPIISKELNIDMSYQESFNSCEVEKIEAL